jgi:hypothetical protein
MKLETDNPTEGVTEGLEAPETAPETAVEALRLPLEGDEPIPYALTARARRVVAPADMPDLQVLDGPAVDPVDEDELDDPRSAQARALRRAGMPVAAIAGRLGVDPFTVRAWLGGRLAPVAVPASSEDKEELEASDAAANQDFEDRIGSDPGFSAGLAVLGALADVDGAAVVLTSDRPAPLAQGLAFLRQEFGVTAEQVRVVLRLGSMLAGDRAIADWSVALGLPADRFRQVRSGRAPAPDGIEVLVRVTGSSMASTVGAWLRRHHLVWRPTGRSTEAPAS